MSAAVVGRVARSGGNSPFRATFLRAVSPRHGSERPCEIRSSASLEGYTFIVRDQFRGYYPPTPEELSILTRDATIVFDACVLLDLYRYSLDTRNDLLRFMEEHPERLWLPHQAAKEYHDNRISTMAEQHGVYDAFKTKLDKAESELTGDLQQHSKHLSLNARELIENIQAAFTSIRDTLASQQKQHADIPPHLNTKAEDTVLTRLTDVFATHIGEPYSDEQLETIFKQGADRYSRSIPPGYADVKKKGNAIYGDLIIWKQMLDYAKAEQRPLLFVTSDIKEDWWLRFKGKTLGPRPQLTEEMTNFAGVLWHMYTLDQFLKEVVPRLNTQLQGSTLDEVSAVLDHDILNNLLQQRERLYDELHSLDIHPSTLPIEREMTELQRQRSYILQEQSNLERELRELNNHVARIIAHSPHADLSATEISQALVPNMKAVETQLEEVTAQLAFLDIRLRELARYHHSTHHLPSRQAQILWQLEAIEGQLRQLDG